MGRKGRRRGDRKATGGGELRFHIFSNAVTPWGRQIRGGGLGHRLTEGGHPCI